MNSKKGVHTKWETSRIFDDFFNISTTAPFKSNKWITVWQRLRFYWPMTSVKLIYEKLGLQCTSCSECHTFSSLQNRRIPLIRLFCRAHFKRIKQHFWGKKEGNYLVHGFWASVSFLQLFHCLKPWWIINHMHTGTGIQQSTYIHCWWIDFRPKPSEQPGKYFQTFPSIVTNV